MSSAALPPPPSLPTEIANNNNASTASSRILTNKVQNAISLNTTTPSFSSALTALSTLQTPNKIDSKSIRSAIEEDALYQAKRLEDEMRRLVGVVRDMRAGIKSVVSIAEGVKDSVSEVVPNDKQSSNQFDEERKLAELLAGAFQERNEASLRYDTIQEFMQKFDLSDGDSKLLENYNFEGILEPSAVSSSTNENDKKSMKDGIAFLDTLKRVTKIRKELSLSFEFASDAHLGSYTNEENMANAKLGPASAMRMVENLASKQDGAFERLYHFLHSRLDLSQASVSNVPTSSAAAPQPVIKIQDGMDETLLHPFIRKSIFVLHQVPAYYNHTLELIATSRRAEVTRKFLLALTSGYDGMPPIEMKAHDPVNYVGDMLAFVFRTMSVESELAKGLFVEDDRSGKGKDDIDEDDNEMSATDVLNDIVSGVARPLKSRLSQVITSLTKRPEEDMDAAVAGLHEEEASTARIRLASLYSICGLLLFYKSAMDKAAKKLKVLDDREGEGSPQGNPLVECLLECIDEAARAYVLSLKVHIATFGSHISVSNESQASVAYEVINRLCDVRVASPGYGIESESVPKEINDMLSVEFLCDTIIDSVLPSCTTLDDAITMKMILNVTKKIGLRPDCASKWETIVSENVQTMIDAQITSDTKDVLGDCGLGSISNAIESMKAVHIEGMVASSHSGLSEESLQKGVKVFYASLFDPPIPSYGNIKDPVLKKYARNKVAENITGVYKQIYDLAKSDIGGYNDTSFFTYDPIQVSSMLSS